MSEYESLSKWAHEFNRTDEMVRGGFTAVVERKPSANSVKVFLNGEAVHECNFYDNGDVNARNLKTELHLQGQDAVKIIKKYFSLMWQMDRTVNNAD